MLERDWALRAQSTPSAADFPVLVAAVLSDSAQRAAGLVVAAFEAARADQSMRPLADQLRSQRAETAAWIVDGLIERASLRPETDRKQARETDSMTKPTERSSTGAEEHGSDAELAIDGAITYLHIPATDVRQAAAFYRAVFGWHINNPDSDRPSFDSPNGQLSGAWITSLIAVEEPGLLPYIYVDHVADTISRILANGGKVITSPFSEGLLTVATFRDPAGNTIGLWHDTTG